VRGSKRFYRFGHMPYVEKRSWWRNI